jgi:hypothetical protein
VSIAQSTVALLSLSAPAPPRRRDRLASADISAPSEGLGVDVDSYPEAAVESHPADLAGVGPWHPAARELVRSGVTQKDAGVVAQILAEHAAGTPPTTIGKRLDVHHTTVNRILNRANDLVQDQRRD